MNVEKLTFLYDEKCVMLLKSSSEFILKKSFRNTIRVSNCLKQVISRPQKKSPQTVKEFLSFFIVLFSLFKIVHSIYEPWHGISNKVVCATSKAQNSLRVSRSIQGLC